MAAWWQQAASWSRLRFNLSGSLPRGVYLLEPLAGGATRAPAPRPGDLVLACPPAGFAALALARGYLPAGRCPGGTEPVGKIVLAVAGLRLDVAASGLRLQGRPLPATATLAGDAAGRPLPHVAAGTHVVGAGEVWLVAPHRRSLDSRYFGPVAEGQILGRLRPLVVAGGADPAALVGAIRAAVGDAASGGCGKAWHRLADGAVWRPEAAPSAWRRGSAASLGYPGGGKTAASPCVTRFDGCGSWSAAPATPGRPAGGSGAPPPGRTAIP